jgi:hypothetical protein
MRRCPPKTSAPASGRQHGGKTDNLDSDRNSGSELAEEAGFNLAQYTAWSQPIDLYKEKEKEAA